MAGKKTKWSSCNLLEPATEGSRLFQFSVSSNKVKLSGDLRVAEGDDPPAKAVGKDEEEEEERERLVGPHSDD